MKYKKHVSILIASVVVIGLSVTTYEKHNGLVSTQKANTISSYPTPLPTGMGDINNSKTWSKYTYNQEFTLSYPPYWKVKVDQDGSTVTFTSLFFHQDNDFSIPYGGGTQITYGIFGEHDISDMSLKNGDKFQDEDTSETMVITNLTHIQIDGYPAVEFDYYPTDNIHFLQTRISILKNHTMYRFNAIYAQTSGKQLFEEILKSIQFHS